MGVASAKRPARQRRARAGKGNHRPIRSPVAIGPVWQKDKNGHFVTPEKSLGYHLAIEWAPKWLRQPDGPLAGEPWQFTKEQARFLAWWYAIDDNGRFKYRSGVYRRMKGAGKNPFAAVICAIELLGPCRASGEHDDQEIGRAHV